MSDPLGPSLISPARRGPSDSPAAPTAATPAVDGAPLARRDRFAVIGAGFSGLGMAAAMTRHGLAFDLLEADDEVGGNWYHGVYETVHIISSRKTTEYSDWPMPASYPDFPSAAQMLAYLRGYAERWGLRRHLELSTRVTYVEPDPAAPGAWLVTLALPDGSAQRRSYGGVIVANGHHWDRRLPQVPGELTIPLLHSRDYKTHHVLDGKRVLVIGGGNSACDIVVEAARFGSSAHLSLRRGYWFVPKTLLGKPTAELLRPWMPLAVQRAIIKALVRVAVGRYQDYGLPAPDHEPFEHHPTINSELLHYLRHGRITPHPDVRAWRGDEVEFVDGTRERFELVVAATGYHVSFPFLAPGLVDFARGMPELIGGVAPPAQRNLFVFGLGQPRYGAGPLISAGAELLCALIVAQRELTRPVGAVLARLGARPPRTYLQDPFAVLRQARTGSRLAPWLPRLERALWAREAGAATFAAHARADATSAATASAAREVSHA